MHDFRRTVKEVISVVKVCESTLRKRCVPPPPGQGCLRGPCRGPQGATASCLAQKPYGLLQGPRHHVPWWPLPYPR